MARVASFARDPRKHRVQDVVTTTYDVFIQDGVKYFQIDTYGKDTRQIAGKQSQTIQFDREFAVQLIEVLRREFNLK